MVASSNSMEVGMVALEKDQWKQWILADSARAELPLSSTKQDTLPVGMAFDTSSTQPFPWGETTLHPMPMILLLSHHGTLCCFNAINVIKGAAAVCHAPEPLQDTSGLLQFTRATETTQPTIIPSKPIAINPTKQNTQQVTPITSTFPFNQADSVPKTIANTSQIAKTPFFGLKTTATSIITQTAPKSVQLQSLFTMPSLLGTKPDVQPSLNSNTSSKPSQFQPQPFGIKTSSTETKPVVLNVPSVAPVAITTTPQKVSQIQAAEVTVLNEDTEALIAQMVKEECTMLETELMGLLHRGYELKVDLGTDSEATSMVQNTNALQDFVNEATETSSGQVTEVYNLKQSLIQTWVWYEEARSRFTTFKDPKLIVLMHAQPLDPASERQLADIHHLFYYLESQLNQANVALDEQWENFQDSCKKKLHLRMPSIEAIYQSMVKQNATLQKQVYVLKDMSNRIRRKNRDTQVPHLLVSLENVDNLEEQLKNLHFQPNDIFHLQHERLLNRQKLLNKVKSDKLKSLLLNRKVGHVSVSKPQLSNMSVQLSSIIGEPFSPIVSSKKLLPQKLDFVQSTPKQDVFMKLQPIPVAKTQVVCLITSAPTSMTSSDISKTQPNAAFGINKPKSSPTVSVWAPNVNVFGADVKNSPGSAFVPTTQNALFNVKSGGSLFGNTLLSSTATTKSATPSSEQKFTFSFNTPVISTTTSAQTIASTNSTTIFSAPVSSSAVDMQKPFFFNSKAPSSTSSTFSFQTVAGDANISTSNSFTGFNFSTSQNSLSKSASGTNLIKPSSAPAFGLTTTTVALAKPISASVTQISSTTVASTTSINTASAPATPTTINIDFPNFSILKTTNAISTVTSSVITSIKPSDSITSTQVTTIFGTPLSNPEASTTSGAAATQISSISSSTSQATTTSQASVFTITPTVSQSSIFGPDGEVSLTPITTSQSIFGAPSTTSFLFGKSPATTQGSLFSPTSSKQPSLLGNETATSKPTTTASSIFSVPSTSSSMFGNSVFGISTTPAATTTTTTGNIFEPTDKPVFGASTTSAFSIPKSTSEAIFTATPLFGTPPATLFGMPTTSISTDFATPTTASVFTIPATTSVFGTPTTTTAFGGTSSTGFPALTTSTTSVFGTPTTTAFGTPTTIAFGTPTTIAFGTPTTIAIGTPTTSVAFATSTSAIFGAPTTSSAFGTPTTSNIFGTPTTSAVFGAAPTSTIFGTTSASSSLFGGFKPTVSTSSTAFGQPASFTSGSIFNTPASTSSGSIFGNTATNNTANLFGSSATPAAAFGAAVASNPPFGSSNVFGTPTTGTSPFKPSSDLFGSTQSNTFSFAAAANAANVSSSASNFGFSKPTFGFGGTSGNSDSSSFSFGNLNVTSPTTTTNDFTSGFAQNQNPFGRTPSEDQKTPFVGGNIFGTPSASVTSTSVFGGTSPFSKSSPAFGSPAAFGSTSQGFGQQSSFGQTAFGSGNVFGSSSQPGPFSGGNQSVNQTGFGSSETFAKPSGFGSAPAFGPSSPGGFGASPAFGGAPTFGSTPAFGSPAKVFGGNTGTESFGSPVQQNSTFANLANQPTLGFGSLAQQSQTPTSSQPTGFSGNSSFSSWR